jgi:thioredoxin reductase (NADPH)
LTEERDVVIAGGGIAGLTAALYSARLGHPTLVLTGGAPGGLLLSIETIEGLPAFPDGIPGYELCPTAQEQAEASGAEFRFGELAGIEPEDGRWRVLTTEGDFLARAVIVATGARLKELDIPGEERLRGKGVSDCASCDAPLLRDRVVGVVGGGDSALQEALTLADAVEHVTIFHRGESFSAQATYQQRVLAHPKISVQFGTVVDEILGDGTVTGVRARSLAGGGTSDAKLAAVFVYVGLQPNSETVSDRLQTDASGRILTDAWTRTELPGVLAAGIVRSDSSGQAVGAAADGATAALAADRYITQGSWPDQLGAPAASAAIGNGGRDG